MADIVRIGREHLSSDGAAALSLRAVARDLGVVSSAVYRYVASRDELLTLLVVAGYDELGDAVDEALGGIDEGDFRGRLLAIGAAVRSWAVREPAMYALLFGSPVPGYHAPAERTTGPGTRVIRALVRLWTEAYAAGAMRLPDGPPVPAGLAASFLAVRDELGVELPDQALARGVLAWAALFGCVSFEVFGQYGADTFGDPAALFEHQLQVLAETVGLVDRR
ncbi:TetR-like C-terminal domain-containing protein [Nocardioides sp. BP30]|uniref:TetR-like C-terminal domain-containing protein n=1 Tax=Nocardioides sp. BP30 TaxID=3036374 RepID=UPI002469B934|nr:TetR-like C-terminal domain-containing protein [Nocardioides sp. BP30]WGL52716.1 TetR-like C-terminal domain-containing protein [Nocardioides sp. BP30]